MKTTSKRRTSFLSAALFSLLSIAVLQQTLAASPDMGAYVLSHGHLISGSSSARSSMSSVKLGARKSSSSVRSAVFTLSPRRHGTGTVTITHTSSAPVTAIKAGCGDGLVTGAEACDDKNAANGDGCSSSCQVEAGYQCSSGQPSFCWSTCGDGVLATNEKCDDGNTVSGDGCSSTCHIELGFKCTGSPSVCAVPAYCGNGVVETGEQCDDGNNHSGDGCYNCKLE